LAILRIALSAASLRSVRARRAPLDYSEVERTTLPKQTPLPSAGLGPATPLPHSVVAATLPVASSAAALPNLDSVLRARPVATSLVAAALLPPPTRDSVLVDSAQQPTLASVLPAVTLPALA
jgi:hypothetical protein